LHGHALLAPGNFQGVLGKQGFDVGVDNGHWGTSLKKIGYRIWISMWQAVAAGLPVVFAMGWFIAAVAQGR
jgi:hypothetical protein